MIEREIPYHSVISTIIRTCTSIQKVVQSQSLCYSQRTWDRVLGCSRVYDDPSKSQVLRGFYLHTYLDRLCSRRSHEVCQQYPSGSTGLIRIQLQHSRFLPDCHHLAGLQALPCSRNPPRSTFWSPSCQDTVNRQLDRQHCDGWRVASWSTIHAY